MKIVFGGGSSSSLRSLFEALIFIFSAIQIKNIFTPPSYDFKKASFVICSRSNTTHPSGNNRCNYNNKNAYRYAVQIARNLDLKIFKYNKDTDKWIEQKR